MEREHNLSVREQDFAQKEADYRALLAMRDSLNAAKSTPISASPQAQVWPDSLQGDWNSRLVCRSSTCNNYVIGDQRNELWQFVADSTGLYVKATSKNKTVHLLKARLESNQILLKEQLDSTSNNGAELQVTLDNISSKIIKGTQYIRTKGKCEANFSIELTPNKK